MVSDQIDARVECQYSNIGEEWVATLESPLDGMELAVGKSDTRAGALRELADAIDGGQNG